MKRQRSTFLVTVTPAHENAGEYQISSEVIGTPDDMDFLTMYSCTDLEQASGYFDEVVRKLGADLWDELEWLDGFNQCLSVGDIAQVSMYQLDLRTHSLSRMANTVIMVGGEVRK